MVQILRSILTPSEIVGPPGVQILCLDPQSKNLEVLDPPVQILQSSSIWTPCEISQPAEISDIFCSCMYTFDLERATTNLNIQAAG